MYYVFLVLMNPLMGSHSVFSHSMSLDHNLTLINWKFYFEGQEAAFWHGCHFKNAAKWTWQRPSL